MVRCTAGHLQGGSDRVAEALPVGGELPEPFAAEEGAVAQSCSGRMGGVMVHQLRHEEISCAILRLYLSG